MPQERMAPDTLIDQTGLTGAVTDIQDDPDSPDGSWLTAPANTATICHVSFPTPTEALDDTAGAQNFRCLVRKTSQSTDPSATVRLYVNGVDTAEVVASTTISSTTGVVLAGTWTSSGIAAAQVECRVTGTTGGGPQGNRASVEVGAVEWNAEVEAAAGIGVVGVSSVAGGTGSTIDVPKPSGTLEGHAVVIGIATFNPNSSIANPTGFTTLDHAISFPTSGDAEGTAVRTAYKIAGASEPATYSFTGMDFSSEVKTGSAITLSGVDTASPIRDNQTALLSSGATSLASPSLTGTESTDMVVIFGGGRPVAADASYDCTAPSTGGWTAPAGADPGRGPASGSDFASACALAHQINGTTGTFTYSSSSTAVVGAVSLKAAGPVNAPAEHVSVTATANAATAAVKPNSESASVEVTANAPTPAVGVRVYGIG